MAKRGFQGIRLSDTQFASYEIESLPSPPQVVISMYQQPREICEPVVKVGSRVKKGQVVGSGVGVYSAPVHASVSGTVTAVTNRLEPSGSIVKAVVIEADGKDEWVAGVEAGELPAMIGCNRLAESLRNAGLVEAGAPSFPVFSLLAPASAAGEGEAACQVGELLIINGVDAEPGVMVRRAVVHSRVDDLVQGIKLLQFASGVRRTLLAVNEEDVLPPEVLKVLKKAEVELFAASSKYPSGLTPLLVKQITGREMPLPNGTPRDVGVLVFDVLTALNVLEAVRDNKPQVEKLVTVWGPGMEKPRNVLAPLGTTIRDIADGLGLDTDAGKVIAGGFMMGTAQYTLDVPVTKQSYAFLIQPKDAVVDFLPEPCIDCGACVRYCPTNLMPNLLSRYCEYSKFDEAERNHLFHCIECGNCAYVCPTKRPMVQFIRLGKKELMAKRIGA